MYVSYRQGIVNAIRGRRPRPCPEETNEYPESEETNEYPESKATNEYMDNLEKEHSTIDVPTKAYKKKAIPATLKRLVWNANVGEAVGKTKCLCCRVTDITQLSFHCGHVVAESRGGETVLSNLKPICQNCNSSMGTTNMEEFMNKMK